MVFLIRNFEILGFSHLEGEILGLSSEIPSISKTRYFDSKAGQICPEVVFVSSTCFGLYLWDETYLVPMRFKCFKYSRELLTILLEVVNGGGQNIALTFLHISYLHNTKQRVVAEWKQEVIWISKHVHIIAEHLQNYITIILRNFFALISSQAGQDLITL